MVSSQIVGWTDAYNISGLVVRIVICGWNEAQLWIGWLKGITYCRSTVKLSIYGPVL